VSSVTGEGVNILTAFIGLLKPRENNKSIKAPTDPIQYDISEHFLVSGVGIVVSGIVRAGTIKPNMNLFLGPDKSNQFRQIAIKSIHVNRVPADEAYPGQFACLAIRPGNKKESINREDFRKGMIVIDPSLKPDPIWEFEAEVVILHHSTTIQLGYQSVLHCGVIRQTVSIIEMNQTPLRTGDRGLVRFRFMYNSEYLTHGSIILLREGRTKIWGAISRVFDTASEKGKLITAQIKAMNHIPNQPQEPIVNTQIPLVKTISPRVSPKENKPIVLTIPNNDDNKFEEAKEPKIQ
jgi:GTPase